MTSRPATRSDASARRAVSPQARGAAVPDGRARAARRRLLRRAVETDARQVPHGRMAAGRGRHAAAPLPLPLHHERSPPDRPQHRRGAAAGAVGRASERPLPPARAGRAVRGHDPWRAHGATSRVARRGPLGEAGPQPGDAGGPAVTRPVAREGVDGRRVTPLPQPGPRRPALRAVAAGRDDRDAPRRARRRQLAGARPGRRAAISRPATDPRARGRRVRAAQVGTLSAHRRA